MQRAGCFDKMGVAADRSGHPCRVLGLAALTGVPSLFFISLRLRWAVSCLQCISGSQAPAPVSCLAPGANRPAGQALLLSCRPWCPFSSCPGIQFAAFGCVPCRLLCLNGSTVECHLSSIQPCFLRFAQFGTVECVQVAQLNALRRYDILFIINYQGGIICQYQRQKNEITRIIRQSAIISIFAH